MGQYWPTVDIINTGFGNTATLIKSMAAKLGVALPTPGPATEASELLAHANAINAHAAQGEWCRDEILKLIDEVARLPLG